MLCRLSAPDRHASQPATDKFWMAKSEGAPCVDTIVQAEHLTVSQKMAQNNGPSAQSGCTMVHCGNMHWGKTVKLAETSAIHL